MAFQGCFAVAHSKQDSLACCPLDPFGEARSSPSMFQQSSAACIPILQPGSPPQSREGVRCAFGPLCSPMEADVKLLSGSKRSCEGYTSLQDEAEADDASMASGGHPLCRSGSVRSFGIKRVCSVASADAIDSHCTQQLAGSIMIPVPGSSNNLQQIAGSHHALPAGAAAKRASKTGSTSSSLEHNAHALAAAAAGQEVASSTGGRKLAPIKTSLPKGPRLRLNGRLLSPEEAQKHLQAVAAAAAAATSGRSLSRAQSPSVATGPGGRTSSPAGPYPCSSMSPSTGAPCSSAGNSSGMCGPAAFKPAHAAAAAAAAVGPRAAAAAGGMRQSQVLSALDVLPENFIPTPEGMGTWHTLASTLEDGCGGATSRGCSSPMVCCSYTELLLAEEGDACVLPPAAAAAAAAEGSSFTARTSCSMGTAPGALAGGISAFAAHSMAPWPIQLPQQQQQRATRHLQLASAGSVSGQAPLSSSSCPVHIPVDNGSSSWTSSKLLAASVSGSNGSSGSGANSLAASLGGPRDPEISELLGVWGVQQQNPQTQQQVGLVTFTGSGAVNGGSGFAAPAGPGAGVPAWKPAFAPAGVDRAPAPSASSGMVPTPGLSAVGSAPVLTSLPQQQAQASRAKSSASRAKKHSKAAAVSKAAASKPTLALQLPAQVAAAAAAQQLPQQVLMVADGAQQVVLSQQELVAIVQQNMAASFASGYMMASSLQGGPQQVPPQMQLQPQPPLVKPVASVGAFVMPPSAVAAADGAQSAGAAAASAAGVRSAGATAGASGGGFVTTAAAASALGSSGDVARLVGANGVDDILPSLQELLTDCY